MREPGAEQNVVEVAEDAVARETPVASEVPAARAADAQPATAGGAEAAMPADAAPSDVKPAETAQAADAVPGDVALGDGVPADSAAADTERRGGGLEERAAEALHALVERGAERIPGDQGSTVSRFAVALLSFGSAMTERGRDKEEKGTSALVRDAVQVFKSLDDDPGKQREAMERALTDLSSNLVGEQERGKALDVAQQAMGLWRSARGAGLATSDDALSLRSLAGMLRRNGDEDGAAQTEEEARRLER